MSSWKEQVTQNEATTVILGNEAAYLNQLMEEVKGSRSDIGRYALLAVLEEELARQKPEGKTDPEPVRKKKSWW